MDSYFKQSGSPSTLYAYTGTYASLPAASGYAAGTQARATDVGINGSVFQSDGVSRWIPVNGRCNLFTLPYTIGLAPTFTGTTNGAITFGTAVPLAVKKGFFYYPANSLVASHAAGFYWTEMSSTTAAVVYNNTYTPAAGVYPVEPASKTAFSGAVPGGTGITATVDAFYSTIVGGLLGESGSIFSDMHIECNYSGNYKAANVAFDNQLLSTYDFSNTLDSHGIHVFKNAGQSSQRGAKTPLNIGWTSGALAGTVDTTVNKNYSIQLQKNSAADVIFLSALTVEAAIAR